MEAALGRPGHGVHEVGDDHEEGCKFKGDQLVLKVGNGGPQHENDKYPSSCIQKDLSCSKQVPAAISNMKRSSMEPDSMTSSSSRTEQDDQLETARAEMGEVREENQRLKTYLDRIMKDYKNLQMQFQEQEKKINPSSDTSYINDQKIEEPELVSLTLGRSDSSNLKRDEKKEIIRVKQLNEDLALGLDYCKFEDPLNLSSNIPSSENSFEEAKEEVAGETWPPSKVLKKVRSGEDEVSQQNPPVKKARVSVRARCETPTMNDGCQWRKYGQKISKGNPCPRAYYRCTVAPNCPVRKQVQRCAGDMSILTSTYEGTHNHPLPLSATAMASTTSAAASMLLSGSSTTTAAAAAATGAAANLHGLNFYLSDTSNSKQFYLPNSSISSSPSYPTITLDLTSSTPSSSSSSSSSSLFFNRFSANPTYPPNPRYSLTNLNFSNTSSESNPMHWGNSVLNYGASTQPYNRSQIYQSAPDSTIAAATKAITADPTFQSALAAALSSIIGTTGNGGGNDGTPLVSATPKGNGCRPNYLNKGPSASSQQQQGNLMFLPPSLPFSSSKSASAASPSENRDHTN